MKNDKTKQKGGVPDVYLNSLVGSIDIGIGFKAWSKLPSVANAFREGSKRIDERLIKRALIPNDPQ